MKITFPHLGNAYIAVESILQGMGYEPITPPLGSRRTLELGIEISPEEVCLPFKILLGNMVEGLELGAEAVMMLGGWGPCRLGYYGEIQRILLEKSGRQLEFIQLEMPRGNMARTVQLLKQTVLHTTPGRLFFGFQLAWLKLYAFEHLEQLALKSRPRELERGKTTKVLRQYLNKLRLVESPKAIGGLLNKAEANFAVIRQKPKTPLKVGLVGEIYTVVEPLANLNIEERLGELGVEVIRTISLKEWVEDHVFKKIIGLSHLEPLKKSAAGYLHTFVGGHGLETVAHSVNLALTGIQGIIQILPLNCNPEIIAQSILPAVSSDYNIPIMSLVVDEHAGEIGLQTRLEAFVDLLERQVYADA